MIRGNFTSVIMSNTNDGKVSLRKGSIEYTVKLEQLFDAVRNYLSGKDVIRSDNITNLHDYLVDDIKARCYELTIEWRESGDTGEDDYPYDLNVDIIVYTENGKIEQNLDDTDWTAIDLTSIFDDIDLKGS